LDYKQTIKDLSLILLYLTSWKEKDFGGYERSWKGYDFDILNELAEEGYISDSKRSKSVVIYDEGINMAKELLKNYSI